MTTPYPGSPGPPPQRASPPPPGGPPPGPHRWAPPPPPPSPPGWAPPPAAPPGRSGALLVLAATGVALVLGLVALAAVVTLDDREAEAADFGPGPTSEPSEDWVVDLGVDLGDDGGDVVAIQSDGDVVLVVVEEPGGDDGGDLRAYAAADGDELWDTRLATHEFADTLRLTDDGQVLVVEDSTTRLLDSRTGEERWEADGRPSESLDELLLGLRLGPTGGDQVVLHQPDPDDGSRTTTVVDRASGEELWSEDDTYGLDCGDVVVAVPDTDTDTDAGPGDLELTGRDAETGDELWTIDGQPGLCEGGEVAVTTADDEVRLVDLRSGEAGDPFRVDDDGVPRQGIPFGDHILITRFGTGEEGPAGRVSIVPRRGGEPTWEGEGVLAVPIGEDVVVATEIDGDAATAIRPSDGEELGELTFPDGTCQGTVSLRTVLTCEEGGADITSYGLLAGFDELWTVDAGSDVVEVAVGGDRAFVVTEDGELVALR